MTTDATRPVPPTFGRDRDLAVLDWLLHGPVEGVGRVLVVEGEPGIGKSHLVAIARRRSLAEHRVVLDGAADELDRDTPGRILFDLARRLGVSFDHDRDHDQTSAAAGPAARGFAFIERTIDAVEEAAARAPVTVIVEDVQWADELSLRGLAALGRRLPPIPVALVVTARPLPRDPVLDRVLTGLTGSATRFLRLGPLDETAIGSIVAATTGAVPGPTLGRRLRGANGNPLLVVEMLRGLGDAGVLRIEDGVADTDDASLPIGLRDSVLRRLHSLPADAIELLRLASLLGREFALADLADIAGRGVVDTAARMHEAVHASVLAGEGEFLCFRHDLIREAIYEDIAPAIRNDLHRAAGAALAARGAPAIKVAEQLSRGAPVGDAAAVDWLERAATTLLGVDPGAAVSLLDRALSLLPRGDARRATIEVQMVEPLAVCGRVEEARALAVELLENAATPELELSVRCALAIAHATAGDLGAAVEEGMAAAALRATSPRLATTLRCLAASEALLLGREPAEVDDLAGQILDGADVDRAGVDGAAFDDQTVCVAHQARTIVALARGSYDDALHHARASRTLLERGGFSRLGFLIPHQWEATSLLYLDRFDEAIRHYNDTRDWAERQGQLSTMVHCHQGAGGALFLAGRWDEAVTEIEAGMAVSVETGARAQVLTASGLLARIALGRGDLANATAFVAEGYRALASGLHLFGVDLLLWADAGIREANGERASAHELLAAVWEQTARLRFALQWRNLAPDLVRSSLAEGDVDLARSVQDDVVEAAGRSSAPSVAAVALRCRGLVDDDARLLDAAVEGYRRTPRRPELAAACQEAAAAYLRHGDRDRAVDLLDEAATIHQDIGAERDLLRVDAQLRDAGVRRRRPGRPPATTGWDALTRMEALVVDLVVEGHSNPSIAAQLHISRRTVETHLAHVFRKLDVSSRTQLAATAVRWAARRP